LKRRHPTADGFLDALAASVATACGLVKDAPLGAPLRGDPYGIVLE